MDNKLPFTVFALDKPKGRLAAKSSLIHKCGQAPTVRIATEIGSFDVGTSLRLLAADQSWIVAGDITPGTCLLSVELINDEGLIFARHPQGLLSLMDLVDCDIDGVRPTVHSPEKGAAFRSLEVQAVQPLGEGPACWVQVDFVDLGSVNLEGGHNFLIWPDGTSFGHGLIAG